jgi:heme exporter protein A
MPRVSIAAPLLTAESLACRRGERLLFRDLGFTLERGQLVWLRGSNGSGKTSLLRVLAGLSPPDAGHLRWAGQPWKEVHDEAARATVYLAHANALKDDLTATEALTFLARLHGQQAEAAQIEQALRGFLVWSRRDAPVRTLSQGQRRRVALARLLLRPVKPLWLLDEPYDALDAEGCALLDGVLEDHAGNGGAIVLTSHLPLRLADPVPIEVMLPAAAPRRIA